MSLVGPAFLVFQGSHPANAGKVPPTLLFKLVFVELAISCTGLICTSLHCLVGEVTCSVLYGDSVSMHPACSLQAQDNPDGAPPTFYHTCTSKYYHVWFSIYIALSAVELMVGAFLAFETRKVNIRELSDSKLIALSIYSLCIVCVALTPIAYLLNQFVLEQYAVFGALLLASVTFILCVLFLPKVCVVGVGINDQLGKHPILQL